ncbi:unnamed protein product, partial [Iphiclides podalirius]
MSRRVVYGVTVAGINLSDVIGEYRDGIASSTLHVKGRRKQISLLSQRGRDEKCGVRPSVHQRGEWARVVGRGHSGALRAEWPSGTLQHSRHVYTPGARTLNSAR